MTTILAFVLVLAAVALGLAALVSYARHDHFAGARDRAVRPDDLGRTDPARLALG